MGMWSWIPVETRSDVKDQEIVDLMAKQAECIKIIVELCDSLNSRLATLEKSIRLRKAQFDEQ